MKPGISPSTGGDRNLTLDQVVAAWLDRSASADNAATA